MGYYHCRSHFAYRPMHENSSKDPHVGMATNIPPHNMNEVIDGVIAFIENNGAAFGMEIGNKLFLTLFRIIAASALGYLLWYISKREQYTMGFIACVAALEAGAIGNIIDCLFYGIIFNAPVPPEVAVLFPEGGGYAGFLYGRVVDMLYFPLFEFYWPDWIPFIGGELFEFFRPVFNIADSAITIGMLCIILFYRRYFLSDNVVQTNPENGQ